MNLNLKMLDRLCLAGVILIAGALGAWTYQGHVKQEKAAARKNELLAQELKELALVEKNLKDFQSALDEARKGLKVLHDRVPENAEVGQFIKRLDSIMNQGGIKLLSVNPLSHVRESYYVKVPLRLTLNGRFEKVCRLLSELESMKRAVLLEELIIRKSDMGSDCLVNLTVNIFEQKKEGGQV